MQTRDRLITINQGRELRGALRPSLHMTRKVHITDTRVERIQISGTQVVKMVVSVISGGCDIYCGEPNALAFPDGRIVAPNMQEVVFPVIGQVICIQATPGLVDPLKCTIWLLSDPMATE